ncbi:hypothetical protein [Sphingobacterium sp. 2149]|uniref:hypothetical protein n=1 Tax=Sphingobacterium sp. 2149 TaxID=2817763 RepID=UPI002858B5E8|nr:hypothetical protein [Sphingobacterium sp. 2149]MDR6734142.1 hypothetical protein [Sphingobacterium sp. 2149]
MKNFEDVRNEYFIELGFKNPESAVFDMSLGRSKLESAIMIERHYTEIGKRFALEVAKESLSNAADNVSMKMKDNAYELDLMDDILEVDKESILSHDNIPEL